MGTLQEDATPKNPANTQAAIAEWQKAQGEIEELPDLIDAVVEAARLVVEDVVPQRRVRALRDLSDAIGAMVAQSNVAYKHFAAGREALYECAKTWGLSTKRSGGTKPAPKDITSVGTPVLLSELAKGANGLVAGVREILEKGATARRALKLSQKEPNTNTYIVAVESGLDYRDAVSVGLFARVKGVERRALEIHKRSEAEVQAMGETLEATTLGECAWGSDEEIPQELAEAQGAVQGQALEEAQSRVQGLGPRGAWGNLSVYPDKPSGVRVEISLTPAISYAEAFKALRKLMANVGSDWGTLTIERKPSTPGTVVYHFSGATFDEVDDAFQEVEDRIDTIVRQAQVTQTEGTESEDFKVGLAMFESLDAESRVELGDAIVLGGFKAADWFEGEPSADLLRGFKAGWERDVPSGIKESSSSGTWGGSDMMVRVFSLRNRVSVVFTFEDGQNPSLVAKRAEPLLAKAVKKIGGETLLTAVDKSRTPSVTFSVTGVTEGEVRQVMDRGTADKILTALEDLVPKQD